ncbi:MAG: hypothetical protein RL693_589 [Verrucomicrobiota bacterium]|jgi:4-hydroxyproline epimerase
MDNAHLIEVIDSHTGGEPTRVVVRGGPDLGEGATADKLRVFREKHDGFRRAIVTEPRGSDVLVGAMLCEPRDKSCVTGVIFFDNATCIGMCGHGTIGLVTTLAHMGRISSGEHRIETAVGVVSAVLHEDGRVSVKNIPACRKAKKVIIDVDNLGRITGDVAWGGNWFFLIDEHPFTLDLAHVDRLTDVTWRIRQAINAQGYPEVDHIVLFGPPRCLEAHSQNFVLCPGKAYDRSPCGTSLSARLACLAADGLLAPGQIWRQESIIGSIFEGSYEPLEDGVVPTITGRAYITAETRLILDENDPYRWGIL